MPSISGSEMSVFKREKIEFLSAGNGVAWRMFFRKWISSRLFWNSFWIICFLFFSCLRLFSIYFSESSLVRKKERDRKMIEMKRQKREPRERILCLFECLIICTFGPYFRDLPFFLNAVFCLFCLIYKIEKDKKFIHGAFFVFERPSCFDNKAVIRCRRGLLIGKKTGGWIGGEYQSEEKIGLLVGELIGKWNRLRKRDVDMALFWE